VTPLPLISTTVLKFMCNDIKPELTQQGHGWKEEKAGAS